MKRIFIIITVLLFILPYIYAQRDLETITSPEELIQYIHATAPSEDAFVALQRLAKPYIDKKDWNAAMKVFMDYRDYFIEQFVRTDNILSLLGAYEEGMLVENIESVNTKKSEYFPSLSIDGRIMYFTVAEGSKGGEDIYYSMLNGDTWIKPKNTGKPFSTNENDAINSISADGNTIVLFGSYKGFIGGGDNFYAEKTAKGWSEIKPFPKPLNSKYWECDGFLTADGKTFFFASDRPGGVGEFVRGGQFYHGEYEGNTDIYVSVKNDTGWGDPVNLGIMINTPFSERSPFLHPDGKTLYFSSDGHYGLGSLDVFRSVRLSDTGWSEWSEPVNLGKELNTSGYDVAYKISTDGRYAYFSSDREGGKGGYDIYRVGLPKSAMPEKNVLTVKGRVTDENARPIDAKLLWYELGTNKNIGALTSDPETGNYIITLPVGSNYSYFAERPGYYSVSNNVDLTGTNEFGEVTEDIVMKSVESISNTPVVLNNIYFDFDRFELKESSFTELGRVVKFLNDNPGVKIEISAHTDDKGSDEYNLALSQKRAESVVSYLVQQGIEPQRLIAKGYGESQPVGDNSTEEGAAKNRRVEMKVLN